MKKLSPYLFIFLSFFVSNSFGQKAEEIKKLKKEIENAKEDTNLINKNLELAQLFSDSNFVVSYKYGQDALRLAEKLKNAKKQIEIHNWFGDVYFYQTNFDKSFQSYYKAFKISDSIKDKMELATSYYNLGWIACLQQKNFKDDGYLYKSLEISEEIDFVSGRLKIYNALGSYYIERYQWLNKKNDVDSSLKYFGRGIDLSKKAKIYHNLASIYHNLSELFYYVKDYNSSYFYGIKAQELFKSDSASSVGCLLLLARAEVEFGKTKEALLKSEYVYHYAIKNKQKMLEMYSALTVANVLYAKGDHKKAYDFLMEYHSLKAEMDKTLQNTSLTNMENNYNLERAEASLVQLRQKSEIQELKDKRKSIYISILIGVGLVIIIIAYLLFRQNQLKQHTNLKLKEQNKVIREKKHEIEQSIEYAKGIQTAFLPEMEMLNNFVNDNFVFYKPKDVVSGDFYWYHVSKDKQEVLIACADCTGHGVPGALMSMVGINMLEQLSGGDKLHKPGTILKHLNNEIKNSLKQNSDQNKQRDGMDVALIKLEFNKSKLVYSGANRPLYLVRNKEVKEIKPTKNAIGGFTAYDQEFDEHELSLEKGDFIVMSTDGYADQFGGEKGKKFMTKKFRDMLINMSKHSTKDQLKILNNSFIEWKGDYSQVDDVCIIGINV